MMRILDRVSEIIKSEADAIGNIRVEQSFENAILVLYNAGESDQKILTTGLGKAGFIARKTAATLSSIGFPSIYLHPAEAMHGDLGIIHKGDPLIVFSTSGKTREVLETIVLGRELGLGSVIGITSHPDSELRELSDVVIDMGIIEEPCPLELTPSASIAVMLAISDAIALTLLGITGFSREDYGMRHHGGYLGKISRVPKDS